MRILLSALLIISCKTFFAQSIPDIKVQEHTFEVDKVAIPTKYLPVKKIVAALEYKIQKKIKFSPPTHKNASIVSTKNNAFIQTIQNCYDEHRPLILCLDIMWLLICQGVSIHVNQNYDTYKTLLLKDSGSNKIEILERDDSLSFENDNWSRIISKITQAINQNLKANYYNFFVPKFSTSTPINKTVFEITMLEAFKKKITYMGESGCGIPRITLKGMPSDWQWIYDNLSSLDKLGLQKWANELKPLIQQFIDASKDNIDKLFWRNIYKNATEYNAYFISGWIIKFFPYIEETGDLSYTDSTNADGWISMIDLIYKPNPYLYRNDYLKSELATNDFPSGVANINFKWNDYLKHKTLNLQFYAGFMGSKQHKNKSLEPFISWAITDTNLLGLPIKRDIHPDQYRSASHKKTNWSPHFAKKVTDSAVFDIKRFKKTSASLQYLRKVILDSLEQGKFFTKSNYSNKEFVIEIMSDGNVGLVFQKDIVKLGYNGNYFYMNSTPNKLDLYVKQILGNEKARWFPALAHQVDVLNLMDATEDEKKLKIKSNSNLIIKL